MGRTSPDNWARHKPRKQWVDIGPKRLGRSRPNIFSFSFLAGPGPVNWARPKLARPKVNVNYLQNMNSGSHSACNWNGCRKWRLVEERLTRSRSLSRDQEVEMMVSVASLGGTVAGVDHRGRKKDFVEVRERKEQWLFQVWGWPACSWDSYLWWSWWRRSWWWLWLVVGTVGRARERKTAETGAEGWFLADFGSDFLLSQVINGASIYRRWKRVISSTPG